MADAAPKSWFVEALSPERIDGALAQIAEAGDKAASVAWEVALAYPWAAGPVIVFLLSYALRPVGRLALGYVGWVIQRRRRRAFAQKVREASIQQAAQAAAAPAQPEPQAEPQVQPEVAATTMAESAAPKPETVQRDLAPQDVETKQVEPSRTDSEPVESAPAAAAPEATPTATLDESIAGAAEQAGLVTRPEADTAVVALQQREKLLERRAAAGQDAPDAPQAETEEAAAEHAPVPTSGKKKASSGRDLLDDWRRFARRNLTMVGLFSVFINLLMLTIPIYLFQISDRVLSSRSSDTLVLLTIMAVGFLAVLALLDILRRQLLSRIATRLETMLGGPVLAAVIGGNQSADQSSVQPLRNLQQVRGFIAGPVMPMLFDGAMAPLYFGAVFLVHPDLGIIAVSAGALLFMTAIFNQRAVAPALGQASAHAAKADANAEALTRNAQVINAMGMLNEGVMHWGREQARALMTQIGAQDRNFWITGFSKFVRLVTQVAMLGWGGYLALNGMITGGTMIAASIIAGRALQPIEGMIEGWRSLVQARASYGRIIAIVDALQREKERLQLPRPKGQLEIEKLLYLPAGGKEPILNGVNFTLEPGESLAILGPSGSGKSTLARILVGCLRPTAGKVRLDSTELRNWDSRQFGEFTGYLPQEVELFPGTIKANISRMREDKPDEDVYSAATFTEIHDLVTRLPNGYETVLETNGAPLSGGQRQRIALARAFFGNPALVVLDEPNANLDANGEQALAETLRNAKAAGVTIVAITQRPALLASVDKVLVLRNGKQEAFGAPQEVMRHLVKQPDIGGAVATPAAGEAESVSGAA